MSLSSYGHSCVPVLLYHDGYILKSYLSKPIPARRIRSPLADLFITWVICDGRSQIYRYVGRLTNGQKSMATDSIINADFAHPQKGLQM